jgi:hypothetical protein
MIAGRQDLRALRMGTWARAAGLVVALSLCLVGCGRAWQATVAQPDGGSFDVDAEVLRNLEVYAEELEGGQAVPLERVLWSAGHRAVEDLVITESDGTTRKLKWLDVAEGAWWWADGSLEIGGERIEASHLDVEPPGRLSEAEASITDIAPTAAAALGLRQPEQSTGRALDVPAADRVALVFLDGFGYVRYTEALAAGQIPNLSSLGEPLVGLTTYPPITAVSSASLLTGAPPEVHGVDQRGLRKTETETLFDVAASAGLTPVAVEGESLAFALRNAEVQLSADFDGDGSTDDNVLSNALDVLRAGAPDVFFVHFHGIDDAGHTYGPGAPEECAAIMKEDAAVGRILELLPSGTLVIIFADHGMHDVDEEGRLGNHGHLVERDMFIPIFLVTK